MCKGSKRSVEVKESFEDSGVKAQEHPCINKRLLEAEDSQEGIPIHSPSEGEGEKDKIP